MRLVRAGPNARYLTLGEPPSVAASRRLEALADALRGALPAGDYDVVPGYTDVLVEGRAPVPDERLLAAATAAAKAEAEEPRRLVARVAYGAQADEAELVARLELPWSEMVARHHAPTYTVAYLGFTPGFGYLHGLDPRLAIPRRDRPRQGVPAGAVAMGGGQAGIYPAAGPGGWWVLGLTDLALFDPELPQPTALRAGDELRFEPCHALPEPAAPREPRGHAADPLQREPLLSVLDVWPGSASLQGRPRSGVGRYGLAQAGALDQGALLALGLVVGSPLDQPALELTVPHATLRAERATVAAYGGAAEARLEGRELPPYTAFAWPAGTTLEVSPPTGAARRLAGVPLLAVAGGLAPLGGPVGHPSLSAGGSTDVRGRVGGFGRWLRAGDVLAQAGQPSQAPGSPARPGHYPDRLALRLHPGPHHEVAAFAMLQSAQFVVAERSRMGVRLELAGSAAESLALPAIASTGMPLGAVQLPPDGRPLVLLADRGRTGGYPVVGVVDRADLAAIAQARPGTRVGFVVPG